MALTIEHRENFHTLVQAFSNGDAALVECQLATSGEPVAVICAANRLPGGAIELVPFATLFEDNPYGLINPPNPYGGFFSQEGVWSG
jgi:hypothetical protein